jgi:hypothetical protein
VNRVVDWRTTTNHVNATRRQARPGPDDGRCPPKDQEHLVKQERLVYPTERLVGIANDRDVVQSALDGLREADVADERVEILTSESTEFQESPDDDSLTDRVVHVLKTALGDETERLEALQNALEAGRLVVQVRLTEDDDDDREEAKRRLGRLLADRGLEGVAFYGKWQIEEIQLGA